MNSTAHPVVTAIGYTYAVYSAGGVAANLAAMAVGLAKVSECRLLLGNSLLVNVGVALISGIYSAVMLSNGHTRLTALKCSLAALDVLIAHVNVWSALSLAVAVFFCRINRPIKLRWEFLAIVVIWVVGIASALPFHLAYELDGTSCFFSWVPERFLWMMTQIYLCDYLLPMVTACLILYRAVLKGSRRGQGGDAHAPAPARNSAHSAQQGPAKSLSDARCTKRKTAVVLALVPVAIWLLVLSLFYNMKMLLIYNVVVFGNALVGEQPPPWVMTLYTMSGTVCHSVCVLIPLFWLLTGFKPFASTSSGKDHKSTGCSDESDV